MKLYKYLPKPDMTAYELSEILHAHMAIPDYIPDYRYEEFPENVKRHFEEDK